MTFSEFQHMRKKATAAEMERAGVPHNKQTQSGWLYPGDAIIESTVGWGALLVGGVVGWLLGLEVESWVVVYAALRG